MLAPQARPDDRATGPTDFRADLRHRAERSLHFGGAAIITAPRRRSQNARVTPEAASQAPIINTIPMMTPVFGFGGKPIINTIPTMTPEIGFVGKPTSHNHVVFDLD